jgi:hypothetical protein
MIDPNHVKVAPLPKQPSPEETIFKGVVTFTVLHRVNNLLLAGDTSDLGMKAMTNRIEHVVREAVWKDTYGQLLEPLEALMEVAKHCPSNYAGKRDKALGQLTSLLTMPPVKPSQTEEPETE